MHFGWMWAFKHNIKWRIRKGALSKHMVSNRGKIKHERSDIPHHRCFKGFIANLKLIWAWSLERTMNLKLMDLATNNVLCQEIKVLFLSQFDCVYLRWCIHFCFGCTGTNKIIVENNLLLSSEIGYFSDSSFDASVFLVFSWRHGGHVGVQNNSEKSLLRLWFYYYAKTWATFCHCSVHQHGRLIS